LQWRFGRQQTNGSRLDFSVSKKTNKQAASIEAASTKTKDRKGKIKI
jgi:hypothetical protein